MSNTTLLLLLLGLSVVAYQAGLFRSRALVTSGSSVN